MPAPTNGLHSNCELRDLDVSFNPADMLPRDEFVEELPETCTRKSLCWHAATTGFVLLVLLCLLNFLLDSTAILNVYDFVVGLPADSCDVNCKLNENTKEIKALHAKVNALQRSLALEKMHNSRQSKNAHTALDVQRQIQDALNRYDADKIGLIDYALESAGGSITATPSTVPYLTNVTYDVMGVFNVRSTSNPRLLIQPETLPGRCFAFHGRDGRIRIKLAQPVRVTSVTMEHAHRSLIADVTSSPKDFEVYGLDGAGGQNDYYLGSFTYAINGSALQTFPVNHESNAQHGFVELHILNNYGHRDYTCVYRFRVHGNV